MINRVQPVRPTQPHPPPQAKPKETELKLGKGTIALGLAGVFVSPLVIAGIKGA